MAGSLAYSVVRTSVRMTMPSLSTAWARVRESFVRVFGVDPGLTRCGVGVVDGAPGRQLTMVDVDVVTTTAQQALGKRLIAIEGTIGDWLDRFQPDALAIERVFSQQNVRTVMGVAQV